MTFASQIVLDHRVGIEAASLAVLRSDWLTAVGRRDDLAGGEREC